MRSQLLVRHLNVSIFACQEFFLCIQGPFLFTTLFYVVVKEASVSVIITWKHSRALLSNVLKCDNH